LASSTGSPMGYLSSPGAHPSGTHSFFPAKFFRYLSRPVRRHLGAAQRESRPVRFIFPKEVGHDLFRENLCGLGLAPRKNLFVDNTVAKKLASPTSLSRAANSL